MSVINYSVLEFMEEKGGKTIEKKYILGYQQISVF